MAPLILGVNSSGLSPFSPSVNPCVVQKKESGRSANHFNCEEKHDECAAEGVFQPDLTRLSFVTYVDRNLEKICRCLRSAFTVFLELTASLCLSCAKEMLHLSQRKNWYEMVKMFQVQSGIHQNT